MTSRVRSYVRDAAARFGVTTREILAPERGTQAAAMARHSVMRRLRDDGFSSPQIGRWLKRDHTTVLYAVKRVKP